MEIYPARTPNMRTSARTLRGNPHWFGVVWQIVFGSCFGVGADAKETALKKMNQDVDGPLLTASA